jgi:hypothetical protein
MKKRTTTKKNVETPEPPTPVYTNLPNSNSNEPVAGREDATAIVATAVTAVTVATAVPTKPAARKRESKKKFPVVAVVTPDGIEGNFTIEQRRPLIAHLPIHSSEVQFHDNSMHYDPTPPCQPEAFDTYFEIYQTASEAVEKRETIYEAAPEHIQEETMEDTGTGDATTVEDKATLPVYAKGELLVIYKHAKTSQRLPETSDVACFWCCHTFEGMPCVIPVRDEKGIYEVYGNYCCPECALSGILEERDDSHVKWEKISLLHRIYGAQVSGGPSGRIYPAPPRSILKMFGGPIGIDSYRGTIRERKVRVDLHLPPMVSILATMDTKPIDFYETTIPKSFAPSFNDRTQKAEEGLRLKRSKPLKDKESTLDAVMNLQIRRVPVVESMSAAGNGSLGSSINNIFSSSTAIAV